MAGFAKADADFDIELCSWDDGNGDSFVKIDHCARVAVLFTHDACTSILLHR